MVWACIRVCRNAYAAWKSLLKAEEVHYCLNVVSCGPAAGQFISQHCESRHCARRSQTIRGTVFTASSTEWYPRLAQYQQTWAVLLDRICNIHNHSQSQHDYSTITTVFMALLLDMALSLKLAVQLVELLLCTRQLPVLTNFTKVLRTDQN